VSAKPEADDAGHPPAKSKKMLILIIGVLLVVVLGAGGAFFFISKQRAAAASEDGEAVEHKPAAHAGPKVPPAYLPLDSMVVNLADPGGERVAQIGVTFEVTDARAIDVVKVFMPTIRSGILLLISQRTAEELLKPEGKKKLAKDILREATIPFGGDPAGDAEEEEEPVNTKKKKSKAKASQSEFPVVAVLFSSFIIQ